MRSLFRQRADDTKYVANYNSEIPVPGKTDVIVKVSACAIKQKTDPLLDGLRRKENLVAIGREICGVVTVVGSDVTSLAVGDEVIGTLPVTSPWTGCADFCSVHEYDFVKKPADLNRLEATSAIGDCVRAYTALHYLGQVCAGDTVLVLDAASPAGYITLQLAQLWQAKVIATVSNRGEFALLEKLHPPVAHIIEVSGKNSYLFASVMEETGGLGVDCIIDNGVRMFSEEDEDSATGSTTSRTLPHKHDILSCLGVGGRWVTSQWDFQLDPPDSTQLFLRGARVCFLFPSVWSLSHSQQGRYQHILQDSVDKLNSGNIKPKLMKVMSFDEFLERSEALKDVQDMNVVMDLSLRDPSAKT